MLGLGRTYKYVKLCLRKVGVGNWSIQHLTKLDMWRQSLNIWKKDLPFATEDNHKKIFLFPFSDSNVIDM